MRARDIDLDLPHVTRPASGLAPWQLRRAKDMLSAQPGENLGVSEVARACRLSLSHFSRSFRVSTGTSPHRWLIGSRIEKAQQFLLGSNAPLAEIALACGFADQSHLSRMFHRTVGASPNAWRRQNAGMPMHDRAASSS